MTASVLDLAREFDAIPRADIFARITEGKELTADQQATYDKLLALGDKIEAALGDKRDEFRERYDALTEKHPDFPWPAQAVLDLLHPTSLNLVRSELVYDEILSLYGCGCCYHGSLIIQRCGRHGGTPAPADRDAPAPHTLQSMMAERFARQDQEKRRAEVVTVASRLLVGDMPRPHVNLNNCDMDKYVSAAMRLIEAAEKILKPSPRTSMAQES